MSGPELKPCPFCGGGLTSVEGKGQVWRGVKGYSDPQFYELNHFGKLSETDDFPTCRVTMRHRTQAEAIAAWNTRTDLIDPHAIARAALEAARRKALSLAYDGDHTVANAIRALADNPAALAEIVKGSQK